MAMVKGSVSVNGDGEATGSGLAKELYDARKASADTTVLGQEAFEDSDVLVPFLQFLAEDSEAVAEAVIDHITANAETDGESIL